MSPAVSMPEPPVQPSTAPNWRVKLAPYAEPRVRRSLIDLGTSVVPYLILSVAMYAALDVSVLLTLALSVPTAGFLLRTYIVFHDCTHGSFLPSKPANVRLGVVLGLLVWSPFHAWRHSHWVHHATAGDLDRRGVGDVPCLTLTEYRAMSWRGKVAYRLFRNPLVMFGLGPIWAMIVQPRLLYRDMRPRVRRGVILTNLALAVMVGGLCWLMGWQQYLIVWGPPALMAASAGVWLFYVQHQFEDTYWQTGEAWTYDDAALKGSSYLRLPSMLQFFTANIGLHHVHHLSARIPNYNLQRAHDDHEVFHHVPTLSLLDGLRAIRLKLYDEDQGRMVTWAALRTPAAQPAAVGSRA
jgi:acyl-lipid omega-6 desaturase (Delta-12 desaturase)